MSYSESDIDEDFELSEESEFEFTDESDVEFSNDEEIETLSEEDEDSAVEIEDPLRIQTSTYSQPKNPKMFASANDNWTTAEPILSNSFSYDHIEVPMAGLNDELDFFQAIMLPTTISNQ